MPTVRQFSWPGFATVGSTDIVDTESAAKHLLASKNRQSSGGGSALQYHILIGGPDLVYWSASPMIVAASEPQWRASDDLSSSHFIADRGVMQNERRP
jgi:hypothetical protein